MERFQNVESSRNASDAAFFFATVREFKRMVPRARDCEGSRHGGDRVLLWPYHATCALRIAPSWTHDSCFLARPPP